MSGFGGMDYWNGILEYPTHCRVHIMRLGRSQVSCSLVPRGGKDIFSALATLNGLGMRLRCHGAVAQLVKASPRKPWMVVGSEEAIFSWIDLGSSTICNACNGRRSIQYKCSSP